MIIETFSGTRGLYSEELLALSARYGKAYADYLKKRTKTPAVLIGYDTRASCRALFESFCRVLNHEGVVVVSVGVLPTQATELAVRHFKLDGGIMITGSHNPPEHNGWKLLQGNGAILRDDQIREVIAGAKTARPSTGECRCTDKHEEALQAYRRFVRAAVGSLTFDQHVIFDPNGGAAIEILPLLARDFGITATVVNGDPGVFNRAIDPNQEALISLRPVLEQTGAQFAFGFDADADRVEMILRDGSIVDGNYMLAMAVELILQEQKGTVVINDATSPLLWDIGSRYGVEVVEVEVGETNVVEKMRELDSPVGGEGSNGGVIVPPNTCRDGILTAFQILKFLEIKKQTIQEIVSQYPRYVEQRAKPQCDPQEVAHINENLVSYFTERGEAIQRRGDALGTVKILYDDGYIFFRASRTELGTYRVITFGKSEQRAKALLIAGLDAFQRARA